MPAFFFGGSLPKEEETAPFASHCGHGLAFAAGWRKVKGEEGMRPITWYTRLSSETEEHDFVQDSAGSRNSSSK